MLDYKKRKAQIAELPRIAQHLRNIARLIYDYLLDVAAARRLAMLSDKHLKSKGPIKVAFILQMPEIWDKLEDVYEKMWLDPRFDPVLFVLPDPSTSRWDEVPEKEMAYGSKALCMDRYDNRRIFYIDNDNEFGFIRIHDSDYVFYQRPYDIKLPKELRSGAVSKYSRVCYVPYAFALAPFFEEMTINNTSFFRNASYVFSESEKMKELMNQKWAHKPGSKYRKFVSLGYPALARYASERNVSTPSCRRVLWTPRWSNDPTVGGSNFLKYMNHFLELPACGFEVRIRPHPLMWDELERKGIMSASEKENYCRLAESVGCSFSISNDCLEDFIWSDLLITDFSSIIVEYYLTGKPIIYCPPPYDVNDVMDRLADGTYLVNSWEEITSNLESLKMGCDLKRNLRSEIADDVFINVMSSSQSIIDYLFEEYEAKIDY